MDDPHSTSSGMDYEQSPAASPGSHTTLISVQDSEGLGDPQDAGEPSIAESLADYVKLLRSLRVMQVLGAFAEERHFRNARASNIVLGMGGASLDAALYVGDDIEFSDLNKADRLRALHGFADDNLDEFFALVDIKATTPYMGFREKTVNLDFRVTARQRAQASVLNLANGALPGFVVMLPPPWTSLRNQSDQLLQDMPILARFAPLAIGASKTGEFYDWLAKVIHEGAADDHPPIPGTSVRILQWPVSLQGSELIDDLTGPNKAAATGFWRLYDAVNYNTRFRDQGLLLDYFNEMPWIGDASFGEYFIEIKDGKVRDLVNDMIGIFITIPLDSKSRTPAQNRRHLKRASVFNPGRCFHYACLFVHDSTGTARSVYWLPCSIFKREWWTGEREVLIPAGELADFRVSMSRPDWFSAVYDTIIMQHPNPKRPDIKLPARQIADNYPIPYQFRRRRGNVEGDDHAAEPEDVSAKKTDWTTDEEDEEDLDDLELKQTAKKTKEWRRFVVPRGPHKVERLNRWCARMGEDVYLSFGQSNRVAHFLYTMHTWSIADMQIFAATPGKVPLTLTQHDIKRLAPVMLFKCINMRATQSSIVGSPTIVSGLQLAPGPFPCLYIFDAGTSEYVHRPYSHLMVPSEFLDYKRILSTISTKLNQPFTSFDDVLRYAGTVPTNEDFRTRYELNLETHILPPYHLNNFQVREGKQMYDSIRNLSYRTDKGSRILWYESAEIYAQQDYMVYFGTVMQELAKLSFSADQGGAQVVEEFSDNDNDDDDGSDVDEVSDDGLVEFD